MRAVRIHQFGPPAVMAVEDLARPVPGDGEVLVRVRAAGVGPWDAWVRAGKSALPQILPLTLGSDISGVVEGAGSGVSGLLPGVVVFGVTNALFTGGYAEYAVAVAGMLARKPRSCSHVEAASVPVVAVTAWQMLFDHAHIAEGQTVLIHGAAGNVGAFAVQMARNARAQVIATTAGDAGYLRDLGAATVIDASTSRFEDAAGSVDIVIDTVGGDVQQRSFQVVKPGGILVSSVSPPDAEHAGRAGIRATFFIVNVTTDALNRVAAQIDSGLLQPRVGAVVPLADARLAHEMLDGLRPRPRGKIVLDAGS